MNHTTSKPRIKENRSMPFKASPMRKVLIALDYDPTTIKVAEKGFSLAKSLDAQVYLLHIIADATYYASPEYSPITGFSEFANLNSYKVIDMEALKNAAVSYLDKLKHHLGDDNIQTLVGEGDLAETILETAKKQHVDMIVMGSHSRRWLEQILLGSTTEYVLHHTSIPLFIIPTKEHK